MIFQVTSVYRRPTEDVKWLGTFILNPEIQEKMAVFLITNFYGKYEILPEQPDPLTLIVKSKWESEEAYNRYRAEQCVIDYFNLVDEYFSTSGIVAEPKVKEHIEGSFE